MLSEIIAKPVPEWICNTSEPLRELPLVDILSGSVYYPASGVRGAPVKYLGGNFHSFVYVDYGIGRDRLVQNLDGFRGYQLVAFRDVTRGELIPNGWKQQYVRPSQCNLRHIMSLNSAPFGMWSIHERTKEYGPDHGPDRFSLLFIGGDGVATFQALYHGNQVTPAVVAVIQPGTGFGCNWTNFEDPRDIFARSVSENPAGIPEYLLFGGWGEGESYQRPCWPEYCVPICELHWRLRLWKRSAEPS
jgi:hypothetical protein